MPGFVNLPTCPKQALLEGQPLSQNPDCLMEESPKAKGANVRQIFYMIAQPSSCDFQV